MKQEGERTTMKRFRHLKLSAALAARRVGLCPAGLRLRADGGARAAAISGAGQDHLRAARLDPRIQGAAGISRAGLGHREIRQDRQAAAGRRAPAEGAAGLQDRQHARRHRRLRRHDAPCHRRPARRLELHRRPDPRLGRHRHRHDRVPDPHRAAVPGRGRGRRAAAEPRQELGMVRGRPQADHAPGRGRQMVGRRSLRLPKT